MGVLRQSQSATFPKDELTMWFVYIVECHGGRLYTGITNDIAKRIQAHKEGRGARFTKSFAVKRLVYQESRPCKSAALRREAEIKSWPRPQKLALVHSEIGG